MTIHIDITMNHVMKSLDALYLICMKCPYLIVIGALKSHNHVQEKSGTIVLSYFLFYLQFYFEKIIYSVHIV